MKPSDDELEAMAARPYSDGDAEPGHPLFYEARILAAYESLKGYNDDD